ncbi:hypothetical protein ABPG74_020337 [Tetrahymena malaccensis]
MSENNQLAIQNQENLTSKQYLIQFKEEFENFEKDRYKHLDLNIQVQFDAINQLIDIRNMVRSNLTLKSLATCMCIDEDLLTDLEAEQNLVIPLKTIPQIERQFNGDLRKIVYEFANAVFNAIKFYELDNKFDLEDAVEIVEKLSKDEENVRLNSQRILKSIQNIQGYLKLQQEKTELAHKVLEKLELEFKDIEVKISNSKEGINAFAQSVIGKLKYYLEKISKKKYQIKLKEDDMAILVKSIQNLDTLINTNNKNRQNNLEDILDFKKKIIEKQTNIQKNKNYIQFLESQKLLNQERKKDLNEKQKKLKIQKKLDYKQMICYQNEIQQVNQDINLKKNEQLKIEQTKDDLVKKSKESQQKIDNLDENLKKSSIFYYKENRKLNSQINEEKSNLSVLQNKISALDSISQGSYTEISFLDREKIKKLRESITDFEKKRKDLSCKYDDNSKQEIEKLNNDLIDKQNELIKQNKEFFQSYQQFIQKELNLHNCKNDQINNEIQKLDEQVEELQKKKNELKTKENDQQKQIINSISNEIITNQNKLINLQNQQQQYQQQNSQQLLELSFCKNNNNNKQIQELKNQIKELKDSQNVLSSSEQGSEFNISNKQNLLLDLLQKQHQFQQFIAYHSQTQFQFIENQLSELKNEIDEIDKQNEQNTKDINDYVKQKNQYQDKIADEQKVIDEKSQEIVKMEQENIDYTSAIESARNTLIEKEKSLQQLRNDLEIIRNENFELMEKYSQLYRLQIPDSVIKNFEIIHSEIKAYKITILNSNSKINEVLGVTKQLKETISKNNDNLKIIGQEILDEDEMSKLSKNLKRLPNILKEQVQNQIDQLKTLENDIKVGFENISQGKSISRIFDIQDRYLNCSEKNEQATS